MKVVALLCDQSQCDPCAYRAVAAEAKRIVGSWADVECIAWGGFSSAERCRLVFGREEVVTAVKDDPACMDCVRAMQVRLAHSALLKHVQTLLAVCRGHTPWHACGMGV